MSVNENIHHHFYLILFIFPESNQVYHLSNHSGVFLSILQQPP